MNTLGLIIWAGIVVVTGILCFVAYRIFVKDWYSNRKSEVKWGLLGCFFSVSFFLFAPLVTMGKNIDLIVGTLHELITKRSDELMAAGLLEPGMDEESIMEISKELSSIIHSFIIFPDLSSPKVQITIASIGAIAIVVIALFLIHLVREQKTKFQSIDSRKHLFEFQESAYNELTKKRG